MADARARRQRIGRLPAPSPARSRRLARDAGSPTGSTSAPYDIRHTAITGNIDKAQRFARHASPVTTQIYDHRNKKLDDHPSYALAAWFSEAGPAA